MTLPPDRARPSGVVDLVLVGALAAHRTVDVHRIPPAWHVPSHLASALGAVAVAVADGTSPTALGLAPRPAWRGALVGGAIAAAAVGGVAALSGLRGVQEILDDPRVADRETRHALRHALVEIPFGTALPEELVFRGVLRARLAQRWPAPVAEVGQAVCFGFWHVLPALEDRRHNPALARRPLLATVVPTVLATAIAGALFGRLRARTGTIAAPVVAHAGINAGVLAVAHVRAVRARRRAGTGHDGDSP